MKNILLALLLIGFGFALAKVQIPKYNPGNPELYAKLLVLDGDKVEQEIDLGAKFVFLVYPGGVYYTDTTIGQMWSAPSDELGALGFSHQATVRKAFTAWE